MTTWHCETCNRAVQQSNRSRHIKSKRHQNRSTQVECTICMEHVTQTCTCKSCNQSWCVTCDSNIFKCPYCRVDIPGRSRQADLQAIQIQNWYASSETFNPFPEHNPTSFVTDLLVDFSFIILDIADYYLFQ